MLPIRVVAEQILGKQVLWDDKGLVVISPQPLTLTDAEVDGLLQEIRDPAPLSHPYYKPASFAEDTVERADALLEQGQTKHIGAKISCRKVPRATGNIPL